MERKWRLSCVLGLSTMILSGCASETLAPFPSVESLSKDRAYPSFDGDDPGCGLVREERDGLLRLSSLPRKDLPKSLFEHSVNQRMGTQKPMYTVVGPIKVRDRQGKAVQATCALPLDATAKSIEELLRFLASAQLSERDVRDVKREDLAELRGQIDLEALFGREGRAIKLQAVPNSRSFSTKASNFTASGLGSLAGLWDDPVSLRPWITVADYNGSFFFDIRAMYHLLQQLMNLHGGLDIFVVGDYQVCANLSEQYQLLDMLDRLLQQLEQASVQAAAQEAAELNLEYCPLDQMREGQICIDFYIRTPTATVIPGVLTVGGDFRDIDPNAAFNKSRVQVVMDLDSDSTSVYSSGTTLYLGPFGHNVSIYFPGGLRGPTDLMKVDSVDATTRRVEMSFSNAACTTMATGLISNYGLAMAVDMMGPSITATMTFRKSTSTAKMGSDRRTARRFSDGGRFSKACERFWCLR